MIITDEEKLEPILSAIRTMTGTPSTVFTINVERNFFPKEMLMHTQDLENIFNNFADKIIEED